MPVLFIRILLTITFLFNSYNLTAQENTYQNSLSFNYIHFDHNFNSPCNSKSNHFLFEFRYFAHPLQKEVYPFAELNYLNQTSYVGVYGTYGENKFDCGGKSNYSIIGLNTLYYIPKTSFYIKSAVATEYSYDNSEYYLYGELGYYFFKEASINFFLKYETINLISYGISLKYLVNMINEQFLKLTLDLYQYDYLYLSNRPYSKNANIGIFYYINSYFGFGPIYSYTLDNLSHTKHTLNEYGIKTSLFVNPFFGIGGQFSKISGNYNYRETRYTFSGDFRF